MTEMVEIDETNKLHEISIKDKEMTYDPEIKLYCQKCQKETFPKYKRELDSGLFILFMIFIFASFFLLLIILCILLSRNCRSKANKNKTKSRDEYSLLGLVLPQIKKTICIDCGRLIQTEKDNGDFILVCVLFLSVIVLFLVLRFLILKDI